MMRALESIKITDAEFHEIAKLIHAQFGICLSEEKKSLVVGRLQMHLKQLGISSFSDYIKYLKSGVGKDVIEELASRISTNHTYFNREANHFNFFSKYLLPDLTQKLIKEGRRDLRIWSAGCSTGQEPYMLVMLMMDFLKHDYWNWQAGVLATDISNKALGIARLGEYGEDQVKVLPKAMLDRYFEKLLNGGWKVRDEVKKEITFRILNLVTTKFSFKKPFQTIFCKNVMIYFDLATRQALVRQFGEWTESGGYLFIGLSETLGRANDIYEFVAPGIYRRRQRESR